MITQEGRVSATLIELADTLVSDYDLLDYLDLLIERSIDVLGAQAGGVLLTNGENELRPLASSDEQSRLLELLELQNSEGPCIDSYRRKEQVIEEELARSTRWPRFTPAALACGYGSVFALPMRLRGEVIGALNIFRNESGAVAPGDVGAAQAFTDMATIGNLHERALRQSRVLAGHLQTALNSRIVIEQAKGERMHQGTAYATDEPIQRLEDLQHAAGEGPCLDAYNLGRPVLEPDLEGAGVRAWPVLASAAVEAGMRAAFGFPLQLDDVSVGALDLYRDSPGPLMVEDVHDARLLAAMATREVLATQSEAPVGSLPARMSALSGDRAAIEQATGMAAAQLGVTVVDAAHRLRLYARDQGCSLASVAHDVVSRTLRLDLPPA